MNQIKKYVHRVTAAFTLIELIGVLAIMAIMAATVAPNALRALDRAAVRAETDSLHNLGQLAISYLRNKGVEPTAANWNSTTVLAPYAWLSPTDMLYNRRQQIPNLTQPEATDPVRANEGNYITRVYVPDPTAANHRALLISSMRAGVKLPDNIRPIPAPTINSTDFAIIWNTPDGTVPALGAWSGWANYRDYLVIERINYNPVYATDLRDVSLTLKCTTATAGYYNIVLVDGSRLFSSNQQITQAASPLIITPKRHPRERLDLYKSDRVTLSYSYVISSDSSGYTFEFDGTSWVPKP